MNAIFKKAAQAGQSVMQGGQSLGQYGGAQGEGATMQPQQSENATSIKFSGYASVFNVVDRESDQVQKGAFSESVKNFPSSGIKLLLEHDPSSPIGIINKVLEDDYGLYVEGEILDDNTQGEAIKMIKSTNISGLSVGYIPRKESVMSNIRIIQAADLVEISIVSLPSNDYARIISIDGTPTSYANGLPNYAVGAAKGAANAALGAGTNQAIATGKKGGQNQLKAKAFRGWDDNQNIYQDIDQNSEQQTEYPEETNAGYYGQADQDEAQYQAQQTQQLQQNTQTINTYLSSIVANAQLQLQLVLSNQTQQASDISASDTFSSVINKYPNGWQAQGNKGAVESEDGGKAAQAAQLQQLIDVATIATKISNLLGRLVKPIVPVN